MVVGSGNDLRKFYFTSKDSDGALKELGSTRVS